MNRGIVRRLVRVTNMTRPATGMTDTMGSGCAGSVREEQEHLQR